MSTSPLAPPRTLVRLAVAAIAVNALIVVTGGVVRVTGSGLGCPDWPTCDGTRVVPEPGAASGWHAGVEFGNRLVTFLVLAVVVALYVRLRQGGPTAARRWAGWLVVGVLGQGVLGGVTVLLGLHPLTVAAHFLASMGLLALAMAVHHHLTRPAHPPVVASRRLRLLAGGVVVGAVAVLVAGTIVTAAGPHAGDPGTPRLGVDIRTAARVHTTAVWITVLLTVAGWRAARRERADTRLVHGFRVLFAVELLQGAVGYAQYLLGIPAALVAVHLVGACLFWLAALRVGLLALAPLPLVVPDDARRPVPTPDASPLPVAE